jgi:ATP-dependent helicase/nuclease subunit B
LRGQVIPQFNQSSDPRELAKIKIFMPTRRSARALIAEFRRQNGSSANILPEILPLGALDDESPDVVLDDWLDPSLPPTVSEFERRMILGELILAWSAKLKHAVVSIDPDGVIKHAPETFLVGAHPVDAWRLAGDLAKLIDEMIIEEVAWGNLKELNGDFDEYWRLTLTFLNIALDAWPKILEDRGVVDRATRQKTMIARATDQIAHARHPVIGLGSTGSNVITAELLAAIMRAKSGAVVLPGLDIHLDTAAYARLQDANEKYPTHPQAILAKLLKKLGVKRGEVEFLGKAPDKFAMREKFISESFRPADTTDHWRTWRLTNDTDDIQRALEDISLIEAVNEREEALAIAVCLRESLEDGARITALVTPDRALAKRVRAELLRWNIEIDDSGGVPIGLTTFGTLARLLLKALLGETADWAALLSHPLVTLGYGEESRKTSRLFEIGVLRAGLMPACNWQEAVAPARDAVKRRDAHPRQKSITDDEWSALDDFARRLDAAVAPVRSLNGRIRLTCWIDGHRAAMNLLCASDLATTAVGSDGEALALLFDELSAAASSGYILDLEAYRAFFEAVVAERVLRGAESGHPRLRILGLLEARLVGATRCILAGMDEATWPPEIATNPLLNRPMREALGLSSLDRRIGQTAHDFCQALGAREVILTRAKKRKGVPTIPSRFLQRMEALAGSETFEHLRRRGKTWLELARCLDESEPVAALRRPEPKPPLDIRPKSLSVTRIETLRRDPYSIYARYILQLETLPRLDQKAGPREIGVAIHSALENFCREHPSGPLPQHARSSLLGRIRHSLTHLASDLDFMSFRWPLLENGIDSYLEFEAGQRSRLMQTFAEVSGVLSIKLVDGSEFVLTCKADRIDLLSGGDIIICDYKTGELPTLAQVTAGFAPQLTLEAAMLQRGSFCCVAAQPVTSAFYIPVGGSSATLTEIKPGPRSKESFSLQGLAEDHFHELKQLLDDFRDPNQGYPARPFPQFASRFNEYDHLARTREWSMAGGADSAEDL